MSLDIEDLITVEEYNNNVSIVSDYMNTQEYNDIEKAKYINIICNTIMLHFNEDSLITVKTDCIVPIHELNQNEINDLINAIETKGYTCNINNSILTISG